MRGHQPPVGGPGRPAQVTAALRLVWASVVFGVLSGAVSVSAGLAGHSLGVLAVGLGVLADVTGSATLIWRFGAERRQPGRSQAAEVRAAVVVAAALAIVSALIAIQAAVALASGSRGAPTTTRVSGSSTALDAGITFVDTSKQGALTCADAETRRALGRS